MGIRRPPKYLELLSGRAWHEDPYAVFKIFRECWPVVRVDWPQRGGGDWLICRYADVRTTLGSTAVSTRKSESHDSLRCPVQRSESEPLEATMLTADPPWHTGLREPFRHEFRMQQLMGFGSHLEAIADSLLQLPSDCRSLDLIGQFAEPLTAIMTAEFLGLPVESITDLQDWSRVYVERGFTFGPGAVSRKTQFAVTNLKKRISTALTQRRKNPRSDLLSRLLPKSCGRGGGEFSERQLIDTSLQMIGAGFQTTKHSIGNSILALIQHPNAFDELAADESLIPSATEELLRYDGASQAVGRFAKVPIELSGVVIPKGAFLRFALGSANRDPAEFKNPDVLNLGRDPNRHLGFGMGPHFCLGANLARLATQVAIKTMLRRFRRCAILPGAIVRDPITTLRGLSRLEVRLE